MKIVKLINGKYALRKFFWNGLSYKYADLNDLRNNIRIFWWLAKNIRNQADTIEEIEHAVQNYTYKKPKEEKVIKKVKFPK